MCDRPTAPSLKSRERHVDPSPVPLPDHNCTEGYFECASLDQKYKACIFFWSGVGWVFPSPSRRILDIPQQAHTRQSGRCVGKGLLIRRQNSLGTQSGASLCPARIRGKPDTGRWPNHTHTLETQGADEAAEPSQTLRRPSSALSSTGWQQLLRGSFAGQPAEDGKMEAAKDGSWACPQASLWREATASTPPSEACRCLLRDETPAASTGSSSVSSPTRRHSSRDFASWTATLSSCFRRRRRETPSVAAEARGKGRLFDGVRKKKE